MRRREVILEATLELAVEKGLESVSMADILERAGVGSGTLYNYFPHKRTLIGAVYEHAAYVMDRYIMREYDFQASLHDRFLQYHRNWTRAARHRPRELEFLETYRFSPIIDPDHRWDTKFGGFVEEGLYQNAAPAGAFSLLGAEVSHQFVRGALSAVVRGHLNGMYTLGERDIDQCIDACWRAVAPSPPVNREEGRRGAA